MRTLGAPRLLEPAGAVTSSSGSRSHEPWRVGGFRHRAQSVDPRRAAAAPKARPAALRLDPRTLGVIFQLWKAHGSTKARALAVESPDQKEEDEKEAGAAAQGPFQWAQNWYPVIPLVDFDTSVPYPFQVLGRKVVFWCDKAGDFHCVLDSCPHRLAPLSEGRVDENGCLQCSYHGWSFNGDGSCARIPQARPEGPESRACEQTRSRAVALPVVVKQGILFVWPDENSALLASKAQPPTTPCFDGEGWCAVETFRDVDYNYDTGMENLVDPAHVPVAHHNVNGGIVGRRTQASWLDLDVQREGAEGFSAVMRKAVGAPSRHTFQAPARFTYEYEVRGMKDARGATTTYCTPTVPGRCRIIVVNGRNFMIGLSSGPEWWQLFPRWLDHQLMMNLLDGDVCLLHGQERYLVDRVGGQPERWPKAYYMPTTSDRYVGAFRTWLTRHGGKKVGWFPGVDARLPPEILAKEEILNRFKAHTQFCRHCRKALRNFERARKVAFVVAMAALGAALVLSNPASRLKAVVFAALSTSLGLWIGTWIPLFYYKGYDHARIP